MIGLEELIDGFREVGLKEGDSLIVHSSYKSIGGVDGGPETVIKALLEVIGSEGNLMLPTFNYTRPLPEPYFDPENTPARTGIIPEMGRKWEGAIRSLHPTHSVAVIGPKARELVADHLKYRAVGVGSPVDRLAQMGGKVLLIGVGHISNTMIHIAEEHAGIGEFKVSWYDELPDIKIKLPDGKIITHKLDTSPSCSSAFEAVAYSLRKRGLIRDGRVGNASLQLMSGKDVIDCVGELIKEKADILLCTYPGCKPCSGARKIMKEKGLI